MEAAGPPSIRDLRPTSNRSGGCNITKFEAVRRSIALAAALVLGAVVALALGAGDGPVTFHGTHVTPPMPPADFTLESADGPVSRADLEGKATALFFGYASCPDVCPSTLLALDEAVERLDAETRERVRVVFITVDPERDTPERASAFAEAVDPSFVGLSGSPEEIAAVAAGYGIYHAKAEGSHEHDYLVDHTPTIVVLNRDGGVELLWSPPITPAQMAEDFAALARG